MDSVPLAASCPDGKPATYAVGVWLLVLASAVFVMAVIGAVTRLTESGLSMVDWHPVTDIMPPLSDAAWQRAFALYRSSPQYLDVNHGMTLAEYRHIYFWEWFHRLWGRVVLGATFALPLAGFAIRGRITKALLPRLLLILALGALQGFVGWFMVRSGLVDRPAVSHYRLAMHLALALVIYATLLWNGLALAFPRLRGEGSAPSLRRHAVVALGLAALTMVWGAFTAGLRAGLVYNTFPLMAGAIVPPDLLFLHPAWLNFFEQHGTVQFTHRLLAVTTLGTLLTLWLRARRADISPVARRISALLAVAGVCQVALGISTLLLMVPVPLAAAHQAGAITVLTLLILLLFALGRRGGTRSQGTAPAA